MQDERDGGQAPPSDTDPVAEVLFQSGLPQTGPSRRIDAAIRWLGRAVSWLWLGVVGLIVWAVIGRYLFNATSIALDEMQWHVAAAVWLLGFSYVLTRDEHVRVDLLYEGFRLRTRCWIELLGTLCLLLPFLGIALYETLPFAAEALRSGERSSAPAGLSDRWILKSVMALSFFLLVVAALSRLLRVTAVLFGIPKPIPLRDGGPIPLRDGGRI